MIITLQLQLQTFILCYIYKAGYAFAFFFLNYILLLVISCEIGAYCKLQVLFRGLISLALSHCTQECRREIRRLQCQLNRVTICFTNSAPFNVTRCYHLPFWPPQRSFSSHIVHIREAIKLCATPDENYDLVHRAFHACFYYCASGSCTVSNTETVVYDMTG